MTVKVLKGVKESYTNDIAPKIRRENNDLFSQT
jgi:hypothetical protein